MMNNEIRICLVGDIFAGEIIGRDPEGWLRRMSAVAGPFERADVRFGNLEAPLTSSDLLYSTGARLRMPPSAGGTLRRFGLDVVSIANNHMMDAGADGLIDTLEALDRAGLAAAGAGRTLDEAERGVVISAGPGRVAFLAVCDDFGMAAGRSSPGVAPARPRNMERRLRELGKEADAVVVSIHTGIEFSALPENHFRRMARRLIDLGATLVVGHHPHVPQGVERYRHGLIAYSLGDFVFDLPRDPSHFTREQLEANSLHPILEVGVRSGSVSSWEVRWLKVDESGTYQIVDGERRTALDRMFESLCAPLRDPGEFRRRLQPILHDTVKELYYYTPLYFYFMRSIHRDGWSRVRPFVWWLRGFARDRTRLRALLAYMGNTAVLALGPRSKRRGS